MPSHRAPAGTGGNDPATYYDKCQEVKRLYDGLLDGHVPRGYNRRDPIGLMYGALQQLSGTAAPKRAMVAQEKDGRKYGPHLLICVHLTSPHLLTS